MDEEARWYPLEDNPMLQVSFSGHGSGTSQQLPFSVINYVFLQ
jgi:hypothetical protein